MTVLVDAKYFGNMLRSARKHNNMNINDAANMFNKTSIKQFRRYERGPEPIPENILQSLFYHGFCLLRCKRATQKAKP